MLAWMVIFALSQCKREDGNSESTIDEKAAAGIHQNTEGTDRTRITIIADRYDTPFRNYQVQMLIGMIRTRAGVEVAAVEVMGHAEVLAQQVKAAVETGAKVLVVFPLKEKVVEDALRDAIAQGVKVLVLGEEMAAGTASAVVKVDHQEMGRVAGRLVVEALGAKSREEGFTEVRGKVVQIRGSEGEKGSNSDQMAVGFEEILKSQPGVKLVHDAPGDWNDETSGHRMREAIRLQQPFDVVFAHNDLMALGAAKVAEEAGIRNQLLIVGVDGAAGPMGGMELVRNEQLEATVYRPPLVDVAWGMIVKWLDDPDTVWPKVSMVKPFLLTAEEVAKWMGKSLPKPQVEITQP